ncbi:tether containing UBX domain for GLUT4 [Entomortierella parvispora]|uniref:Tether containing UBX domain for GLUT4 n=1 Tax=Entomortierella parvispora TaxID=205924 RepID=A0A9P3H986_9FUNG|nr:tether containing UBX domain for GLUT4 [Entomortierella parvispora]
MASNLTVNLGGGKKQLVKTTPTMILRQVVNSVCEKQGYAEPETYGLKSGKNFLDLSLSIRYASIAPGAKLELARVPKDRSAPTHVDLALQLEDGGRTIRSFAITSTLWDVLLGFEAASNGTLNLTRRTAVPQPTSKNIFLLQRIKKAVKPASQVYLLPVVILLEREYVSIPTLKTTTLQLAGLLKGNSVFRVMMRFTDASIEDFMEEIEKDYSKASAAPESASPAAGAQSTQDAARASSSPPSPAAVAASAPSAASTHAHSSAHQTKRTTDKTAGEKDFIIAQEAYHGGSSADLTVNLQGQEAPTGRSGDVEILSREGHMAAPAHGAVPMDIDRPTPTQDMNALMVQANQEIRQLREEQTQAAMTDRVKKLSKASDSDDRERFVRSLPPGAGLIEEPASNQMDIDPQHPRSESPSSTLPDQQELVRQIAHRVSQQLRDAEKRGDGGMDYHALIAQEIEKEQLAGSLPTTPTGSRQNSVHRSKDEGDASPRLVSAPGSPQTRASAKTGEEEAPFDRNVKVFRPPADNSTPLSNQIELPDDFYTLSAQDVMKLMNSQKKLREEEEKRGFKTAAVRAEEEKAKERRYPKTVIRVRFPDRVQIQATFKSQETIGDLRKWVAGACVGQGEKFELYTTPPKKVLSDNKQTLYQAGLAPQSIVYFSWADSKLNLNPPFLNGEHMMKLQDLPIPGQEAETNSTKPDGSEASSSAGGGQTLDRTGSIPLISQSDRQMSQRMSTDKPSSGGSSGGFPKWMKLPKK